LIADEEFFGQFDDDAPSELDVLLLRARSGDGKAQEVTALALGWDQVDSAVVVDRAQQLPVQLVATLYTVVRKSKPVSK